MAPIVCVAPPRVRIGVHLTSAAQDLERTLAALHETVAEAFELLLLVDPNPGQEAEVEALAGRYAVQAWRPPEGEGGAPICFNRLLAEPAEYAVFIEAGARPGPEWLRHLVSAVTAEPGRGLAGPSTDWGWNRQAAAGPCGATAVEVEHCAERLARQHGEASEILSPLHDILDICFLVRREVVDVIGGADPAYGRGPCWEMDYAARAAQAGFASVWAKSAFVRRAAADPVRRDAEGALLESAKRLYQDRFCGRRRPGQSYHDHCAGSACPDFRAPGPSAPPDAEIGPPAAVRQPLISCVMPTRGRAAYVARAIMYFRRQDYPNRELIIVHDTDADLPPEAFAADIRLVRARQSSIGAKRNEAIAQARGEIIVQWDDDDWHGPTRLSRQAAPILQGVAEITGLTDVGFLVCGEGGFWGVTRDLFRRLFVENVHGGTLAFRRDVWAGGSGYPATSLREDADFLLAATRRGARLCRLPANDLWIYVRHDRNSWKFVTGTYLDEGAWSRLPQPDSFQPDEAFYRDPPPVWGAAAWPTPKQTGSGRVSCIMPTANRRAFAAEAIRQFLEQDHGDSELVIMDDGEDAIADLVPTSDRIVYRHALSRATVGAKRNAACQIARGDVILHWDDDDWRAPGWIGAQLRALGSADICGLDRVFFHDPGQGRAWRYVYDGDRPWVYGGTLCYDKAFWARNPFEPRNVGEDNLFLWNDAPKTITVNPDRQLYVGIVHGANTSRKDTHDRRWRPFPIAALEQLMGRQAASAA